MLKVFGEISKRDFAYFFCLLFVGGLLTSKFLLSICGFAFAIIAVFDFQLQPRIRVSINRSWRNIKSKLLGHPEYLAITIIFWIWVCSGLWSSDLEEWFRQVRVKLPFLILPVSFIFFPRFTKQQYYGLFYFLIANVVLSAIFVVSAFLGDQYIFNTGLGFGQGLPVPINHIRYSMLVAIAIVAGLILFRKQFYLRFYWERYILLGFIAGLTVFIHLLAVRTGILSLYIALFLYGLLELKAVGKGRLAIIFIPLIILAPLLAYNVFPGFKQKIDYMIYDLDQYKQGIGEGYSDSERLRSWNAGLELGRESPLIGLGFGDLRPSVSAYYREHFKSEKFWKPHNQFITVFLGSGILGLILFLFALYYPIFYQSNYTHPLLIAVFSIVFISMLVENTLDTSIGMSIYLIFILASLKFLRDTKEA
jgi:O-antigen ligase